MLNAMPHRAHLFSLRPANALRETALAPGYTSARFTSDLMAGVTVGIIAIPLAMALAIASGVPPQHGLYTAAIAGFLIALLGGSRYSVSGPTAAFVVILHPIALQYGLAGLLVATVLAGCILVAMALFRLGRLIEYIPESVTLGFTAGIGVVIAVLQVDDFLGLGIGTLPEAFTGKLWALGAGLSQLHWPSFGLAALTLAIMLSWPRLKLPVPAHLVAVVVGSLAALALARQGLEVDTIGSRFSWVLPDGSSGQGIPPVLPHFVWPWLQPGSGGASLSWDLQTIGDLLPAAFAIAMLGAIESLLCAVVLDNATGTRHSANSELLGQGIGNIVVPFFGGIVATAAIARSFANIKAGAQSPVAAMIHGLVVLASIVLLARLLAYLPMPTIAAMLLVVAWNMSEAPKALHLLRTAPRGDLWVFAVCFGLTVMIDMVVAITTGIVLAALLFVKEVAAMTRISDITDNARWVKDRPAAGWKVFRINGPLFFAAADRVFGELSLNCEKQKGMVLHMDGVSLLDAGGLTALNKLVSHCRRTGTRLLVAELQFQPLKTLARAGVKPIEGVLSFHASLPEALVEVPHRNDGLDDG
jgi:SulP family sulfate permease